MEKMENVINTKSVENLQIDITRISAEAILWETDLMLSYIYLKEVEKTLKESLESLGEVLFSNLEKYDLNDLPMGYTGRVQTRLTVNYASIPEYKEKKEELIKYEKLLKQAVDLSFKNQSLNDEDWVLVPVADFKQSSSFVLTKKRK